MSEAPLYPLALDGTEPEPGTNQGEKKIGWWKVSDGESPVVSNICTDSTSFVSARCVLWWSCRSYCCMTARERSSAASLELTEYSQVDMLGSRYNFVNFAAGKSLVSQID